MTREEAINGIIRENGRRNAEINAKFNPLTGEGSVGERRKVVIDGFPIREQWLPVEMADAPLVRGLEECGSITKFVKEKLGMECGETERQAVINRLTRMRCLHDFPFWASAFVYIKNKDGGEDVLFRLTRPQRKFVELLEKSRKANKPIRVVLLKARQWGGSTTSQIYMAWLQLMHKTGLNSLVIAHQGSGSDEIKDMFDRMIKAYPAQMLHAAGEDYDENETKMEHVGKSGSIYRVPQRNCKIKIGTAERPDACRGGDYSLVHLSEVGLWKTTEGKKPEDIVRSACSGVLYAPYTMIVYESTANGTGNFFQREYDDAKKTVDGRKVSQFEPLFVSWFDIEKYSLPLADTRDFAARLWDNRASADAQSNRQESGKFLWWLWEKGATLEAVNWYISERAKYNDHASMASEYPSDDIEAFVHSGTMVFDKYKVDALRKSCREPRLVGDVYADGDEGKEALKNLRFAEDRQGMLHVWELPEPAGEERITDRYLAVVDVGGRSGKSDWSVIVVIDRLFMIDGGKPSVVAQWYGHIDMDLLAWKAAQVAAFYDNALLVIESNTLETRDRERDVDGDQSRFILNQIRMVYANLYARKPSDEDILQGLPVKYGFHTNVSTKPMVISTLVKVIRENLYVERDARCLDEYLTYEKKPNGAFGAVAGKHDDLLMTRAIGLHVCFHEMETPRIVPLRHSAPVARKRNVSEATI